MVLISKNRLDELLKTYSEHQHCASKTHSSALKSGGSADSSEPIEIEPPSNSETVNPTCSEPIPEAIPSDFDSSQQNCVLPKDVILQKDPMVTASASSEHDTLSFELILHPLWRKFKRRGEILLRELQKNPLFKFDSQGIIAYDNVQTDLSVFRLMKVAFYEKSGNIQPYFDLLQNMGLSSYILNSAFTGHKSETDSSYPWYYLESVIIDH